jgi:hypothetical protein
VSDIPISGGLRAMKRILSMVLLGVSLLAMSSCSCTERGNHAVRRMWVDYNTLRAPAFYVEQDDHLPYPATQVGYYRWMYDKDPGHQLACLGPIPPPTCRKCDPVPAGEDPFEYEVYFPTGVPRPSDQLWGSKLPEPVNVPGAPSGALANGPTKNNLVPILPPPPRSVEEPANSGGQKALGTGNPTDAPKAPSRLPTFDVPAPQSKPVEENPAPLQGPAAQQGPNMRLTTEQTTSSTAEPPLPSPDSVWPR